MGGGIVDDQTTQDILAEAIELEKEEQTKAHLPYIGLEVELPYMGITRTENPHASFVAFMEFLPLINDLGIPTEIDKQGEVALPKSRSTALQLRLLELIHQEGYLPVDRSGETTPKYTLHVNIGTPATSPLIKDLNEYWRPNENVVRFWTLGAVCGILYSNRSRIDNGAYYEPTGYKGEKKPDYRIELRTLSYNPNKPYLDNVEMLEDLRLIALPATHELSTEAWIPEIALNFRYWVDRCIGLLSDRNPDFAEMLDRSPDEDIFKTTMLKALDDPELMASLRTTTNDYMETTRSLVEKYKEKLTDWG